MPALICGGKYVIKSNVNANDAVESLAKISYGPINAGDVKSVLNGKGIDVTKAFEPTAATVMYTLTAGSTTGTTNTTKPSPKTFDAGIAMYDRYGSDLRRWFRRRHRQEKGVLIKRKEKHPYRVLLFCFNYPSRRGRDKMLAFLRGLSFFLRLIGPRLSARTK